MAYENKDHHDKVLYYLDELSGYKVASEDNDVRGWEVVDPLNRTIGEVDNLLVNKNTERVVYLDVEIDDSLAEEITKSNDRPSAQTHEFVNEEGENHLIIPVGTVTLDEDNKKVYAKDIAYERFLHAKWIKKGTPIDRDYETRTFKNYFPEESDVRMDEDFYDRREFRHRS
ncbi:MAG: photosystem reaction center subunit H [Omnitrophica WOR_2 bacterium]|jgi:sporulation protein YlmC with PRC-barrel domain